MQQVELHSHMRIEWLFYTKNWFGIAFAYENGLDGVSLVVFVSSSGTGQYILLVGQHQFLAAQAIRRSLEKANRAVPSWCTKFRCRVLRPDLDLGTLQRIAAQEEAKECSVAAMTFAQTMFWYWKERQRIIQEAKERGEKAVPNKVGILRAIYNKTGKNPTFDGPVVCKPFLAW